MSDSPLTLNLQHIAVLGAFRMGLPSCPIKSQIIVNIPGGNERFGVDVAPGATYDVHGYIQVGLQCIMNVHALYTYYMYMVKKL